MGCQVFWIGAVMVGVGSALIWGVALPFTGPPDKSDTDDLTSSLPCWKERDPVTAAPVKIHAKVWKKPSNVIETIDVRCKCGADACGVYDMNSCKAEMNGAKCKIISEFCKNEDYDCFGGKVLPKPKVEAKKEN